MPAVERFDGLDRAQLRARLEAEFVAYYLDPKTLSDDLLNRLWNKAWEDGHAAGNHEVAQHYEELADLVVTAYAFGEGEAEARNH